MKVVCMVVLQDEKLVDCNFYYLSKKDVGSRVESKWSEAANVILTGKKANLGIVE